MDETGVSSRQQEILRAVIEYYVKQAEPIGSEVLVKTREFQFSPATTRNEMAELTRKGLLEKDHSSAGRYPSPSGFRYYIKNLMEEQEIPVVNEVAIKQRLWNYRHDLGHLLREAVSALSEQLQNLTFIITEDNKIYVSGSVHILRHPEFFDIDLTRSVLHLLDQLDLVNSMLSQIDPEQEIGLLLGEETGLPSLSQCGIVSCRIDLPHGQRGYISVLGPYRLDYSNIIPAVRYMQHLVNELTRSW